MTCPMGGKGADPHPTRFITACFPTTFSAHPPALFHPEESRQKATPAASPILAMTSISYQHGLWALLELESVPGWPG